MALQVYNLKGPIPGHRQLDDIASTFERLKTTRDIEGILSKAEPLPGMGIRIAELEREGEFAL